LGGHQGNVQCGCDRKGAAEIRRRVAMPAGTMMVPAMRMAVVIVTIVIIMVVILMTIVIVVMHV
jgi:hypothetical protein